MPNTLMISSDERSKQSPTFEPEVMPFCCRRTAKRPAFVANSLYVRWNWPFTRATDSGLEEAVFWKKLKMFSGAGLFVVGILGLQSTGLVMILFSTGLEGKG